MNAPRMQHYLPQGYLRGFAPQGHGNKTGKLRIIDLLERKCFSAGPQDVAKVRDYYVFINTQGEADYRIETELFNRVDNDAARIIRQIDQTQSIPKGGDWEALCAFIAFMQLRTPQFRQANQEVAQHAFDLMANDTFSSREAFEESKKRFEAQAGEVLTENYEAFKDDFRSGDYIVEPHRNEHIQFMLGLAPRIAEIAQRMTPYLLFTTGKGRFVTGDVPIHFWDTNEERRLSRLLGVGWMTKGVEVSIPLTSRCCLVLTWGGYPDVLPATDFAVANCNYFRAAMTRQYVFGPHADVPLLLNDTIVWGEQRFIEHFANGKETQPGIEITGGPIPRRRPHRARR